MRLIKKIFSNLHRYLLWLLISVFLWAFVYFLITDTTREKKVTIYVDAPEVRAEAMADALELNKPEGIKMIKAYPFSYAAFNSLAVGSGDIYIMSESAIMNNLDVLCPIGNEFAAHSENGFYVDGSLYGICLRSVKSGVVCAGEYITFDAPGAAGSGEDYYICFNKRSIHILPWTGVGDDAAAELAESILELP